MRVDLLIGPPGAGKGTQGDLLVKKHGYRKVATGDLLRDHVARRTDLGQGAAQFMDAGRLVPDSLLEGMMAQEIAAAHAAGQGVLLDGYPRTPQQVEALDEILAGQGSEISCVLLLEMTDRELTERLVHRLICEGCRVNWNTKFHPPARPGICDFCDGKLFQRSDDRRECIEDRLEVYHADTAPIIELYRQRGCLRQVKVGGDRSPAKVLADIEGALGWANV